jgi:hypothetical protein
MQTTTRVSGTLVCADLLSQARMLSEILDIFTTQPYDLHLTRTIYQENMSSRWPRLRHAHPIGK